ATYYVPNGGLGACGTHIGNSDMAVALTPADYAHGAHCGKQINVHYKGKTIKVTVRDECPGCKTHGLDLTRGAFAKLADLKLGVLDVTWEY
ncbi:RlpA-like double-psi beta-barrel-protein domain-containing protein-containing protein, partial [Mycena galopus ATCC 62051]